MTEANQRKLYEWFIESGQLERAKEITDVPRYAHFAKPKQVKPDKPDPFKPKGKE